MKKFNLIIITMFITIVYSCSPLPIVEDLYGNWVDYQDDISGYAYMSFLPDNTCYIGKHGNYLYKGTYIINGNEVYLTLNKRKMQYNEIFENCNKKESFTFEINTVGYTDELVIEGSTDYDSIDGYRRGFDSAYSNF